MAKLYYTPPSNECFDELKTKAIEIWKEYNDTYGYASGKINRIKDIQNIEDNFMYMVAMFDFDNQLKLAHRLSQETCKAIRERMLDGGNEISYIMF